MNPEMEKDIVSRINRIAYRLAAASNSENTLSRQQLAKECAQAEEHLFDIINDIVAAWPSLKDGPAASKLSGDFR
jgi:hypothetical protein